MNLRAVMSLGTLAATLSIAGNAAAATAPDWVRVRSISYAGSGCPAGTVAQNIAPDRLAFTLLFDSYLAEAGPSIPPRRIFDRPGRPLGR